MIHRFDLTGKERGRYDHGVQGRWRAGLPPVAYDPGQPSGHHQSEIRHRRSGDLGLCAAGSD